MLKAVKAQVDPRNVMGAQNIYDFEPVASGRDVKK
jgi:hypothetical protein